MHLLLELDERVEEEGAEEGLQEKAGEGNRAPRIRMLQAEAGGVFLHEHPAAATSWSQKCIKKVMRMPGVSSSVMHMCKMGMVDRDGKPVKKPTRWMSNSPAILKSLEARCSGDHEHGILLDGKAAAAAVYPPRCDMLRAQGGDIDACEEAEGEEVEAGYRAQEGPFQIFSVRLPEKCRLASQGAV